MSYRHDSIVYDPEEDIWCPVVGFPKYLVSATGHVCGPGRHGTPQILTPTRTKYGHEYISLYQNGIRYREYVHRLVADAFIPNPYGLPIVRHLDSCPYNNDVDNLAWGTQSDNINDMREIGNDYVLNDEDREKAYNIRRTPIKAINIVTGEELYFRSQQEASRILDVNQSVISEIISKKPGRHTAKGYVFENLREGDY